MDGRGPLLTLYGSTRPLLYGTASWSNEHTRIRISGLLLVKEASSPLDHMLAYLHEDTAGS